METINRKMGVIPDKVDIRDYTINKAMARAASYPESFSLDCGTRIKDQGSVGSCVAHATSEIMEYHLGPEVKLSTNFIYGIHYKLFGSKGPGMFLREACKIIKDYGDPQEEYCRGNTEVEAVYGIAEKAFNNEYIMENAKQARISKYAKLSGDSDIKYSLMNHGPVLASMAWYSKNVCNRATGLLTKDGSFDGYHAIMIYGWTTEGWLCQNSWGTYWGKRGTFILPFNYGITAAYSLVRGDIDDIDETNKNKFVNWLYKVVNTFINIGLDIYNIIVNLFRK